MPKVVRRTSFLVGLLALAPAALAGLLDDAKNVLGRLASSDLGRPAAEAAVQQARAAAEGVWPPKKVQATGDLDKARDDLAAARKRSKSKANATADSATKAKVEASLAAAEDFLRQATDALGRANSAGDRFLAGAPAKARTAIDKTIEDLQGRADSAKRSLRILIPPPGGERPATRRGKCKKPVPPFAEFDCDVPNPPPSDDDIRKAVQAANEVLADAQKAGRTASARFQVEAQNLATDANAAYVALANVMKKFHDAQKAAIQNMR